MQGIKRHKLPVHFFKDETEAGLWLEKREDVVNAAANMTKAQAQLLLWVTYRRIMVRTLRKTIRDHDQAAIKGKEEGKP